MVNNCTRKVVVIKDIPSNLVEEAILILKNEPIYSADKSKQRLNCNSNKTREDFIIKEAELIIDNYIKESKKIRDKYLGQDKSYNASKNKFFTGFVINLALIGSLALFVFLLLQLI